MPLPAAVVISGAVEGLVDEAVLRVLIRHVGASAGPVYGKHGKDYLLKNLFLNIVKELPLEHR